MAVAPFQVLWNSVKGHQMSTSPSSIPEHNSGKNFGGTTPWRRGLVSVRSVEAPGRQERVPDIRRQAMTIIEALMADGQPALELEQLRKLVEAYPGQPEVALARHLLSVRPLLDQLNGGEEPDHRPGLGGSS